MNKFRYSLKTNPAWCLNWQNGWIKFGRYIVRWNTTWYEGEHVSFLISKPTIKQLDKN